MIGFVVRYLMVAAIVLLIPNYLKGISVDGFSTALLVALIMGFLNTFIKPVLNIISLPISILSLGLFSLVINVALVYLVAAYVPGFQVQGFIAPLVFSFVISIANSILGFFTK